MHRTLEFNPCNSHMFFQGITCRHLHSKSFPWPLRPWQDQILLLCSVLHMLTSRDQKAPASIKVNCGLCANGAGRSIFLFSALLFWAIKTDKPPYKLHIFLSNWWMKPLASMTSWKDFPLFRKAQLKGYFLTCSWYNILNEKLELSKISEVCTWMVEIELEVFQICDIVNLNNLLLTWCKYFQIWLFKIWRFFLLSGFERRLKSRYKYTPGTVMLLVSVNISVWSRDNVTLSWTQAWKHNPGCFKHI